MAEKVKNEGEKEEDKMFDPKSNAPATSQIFTVFLKIALPAIFTNLMGFATVVTNGIFAGQMNDSVKLGAVGLTSVVCNLMVQSIMIGLNSA